MLKICNLMLTKLVRDSVLSSNLVISTSENEVSINLKCKIGQ